MLIFSPLASYSFLVPFTLRMVKKFDYSVIFLSLLVKFVFWGLFSTFSMYFQILVDYYGSSYALIGTVGTGVAAFSSFAGTLPGVLVAKYSYPILFVVGGLLMAASYFWTSYDGSAWEMFFTYSILFGFSGGILSQISVSLLFDAVPDDLVTMIVVSTNAAAGLGYVFFACFSAYALYTEEMEWQVLFRYFALGGLSITVMSVSFLWIDTQKHPTSITVDGTTRSSPTPALTADGNTSFDLTMDSSTAYDPKESAPLLSASIDDTEANHRMELDDGDDTHGFELLFHTNPNARNLFISNFIGMATRNLPLKFSIIYMSANNSEKFIYYIVPISIGLSVAISRVLFSLMFMDKEMTNSFKMSKYSQIYGGIVCICIAFCPNIVSLQLTLLCIHEVVAGASVLIPLRMVELIGKKNHHHNFGVS